MQSVSSNQQNLHSKTWIGSFPLTTLFTHYKIRGKLTSALLQHYIEHECGFKIVKSTCWCSFGNYLYLPFTSSALFFTHARMHTHRPVPLLLFWFLSPHQSTPAWDWMTLHHANLQALNKGTGRPQLNVRGCTTVGGTSRDTMRHLSICFSCGACVTASKYCRWTEEQKLVCH